MSFYQREDGVIEQSASLLAHFTANNPKFTIDAEQLEGRGGTNFVTLGHYSHEDGNQQPIVFKYFPRPYRWAQEFFCLRHFAATGYVPKILAHIPKNLIVMERLPGSGLGGGDMSLTQQEQVSNEIGQAVATLVQWPMPAVENWPTLTSEFEQFAWRIDLGQLLEECVSLCRQIQEKLPAYRTPFFTESLELLEQQIEFIDQQPRILYHEDMPNLIIHQGHFRGFYDLEMVRVGTEAIQLGVVLHLCRPPQSAYIGIDWSSFVDGYQKASGRILHEADFEAILAMCHFYRHLRVCRWLEWAGDPSPARHMRFATMMAEPYHESMKQECHHLEGWVDLNKWFPSLGIGSK